jgi:hypothetical protein
MLSLLAATAAFATAAAGGANGTTIRFDGIGPLRLGMTTERAVATGVLRSHAETCLDGPVPLPVTYASDGPKAAPGAGYTAYFRSDRLTTIVFYRGVHTRLRIRPGVSTGAQMAARYRRAGYTVRTYWRREFLGTFVDVLRRGRVVMTGFSQRGRPLTVVAIPSYPRC